MRFAIADDHPFYREALVARIRTLHPKAEFEQASSVQELRTALDRPHPPPDLVLMDLSMPGMSIEALAQLIADFPALPFVVVSGTARNDDIRAVAKAGARGFIPKTADPDAFAHTLQLLLAGGTSIPAGIFQTEDDHGARGWTGTLSARERDILGGIVLGQSNKEIARRLGLAEVTIKLHLSNLFRKMNVRSRSEAAVKAVKSGLG